MSQKFSPVDAFLYAADTLPYYKSILTQRGVNANLVTDLESFEKNVPVLKKEDIFSQYSANEICLPDQVKNFVSAIVTSGTSGKFAFGLVMPDSLSRQQQMLDGLLNMLFQAEANPPIIINALPMGVSFVSSYPVVPVGTRMDIATEVIKNFGASRQVIIITDPRLLHKMLQDGVLSGVVWEDYQISAIVGGVWFSESHLAHMQSLLNGGEVPSDAPPRNLILSTMGITEIGLNLFSATPDMILLRSALQKNTAVLQSLFGVEHACPLLAYFMSEDVYPEVLSPNSFGAGELVLTHLDNSVAPMLVRYNSGDTVKFLTEAELEMVGFKPQLPYPVVAVYGRSSQSEHKKFTDNDALQALFSSPDRASVVTGNFEMVQKEKQITVYYQLRDGCASQPSVEIEGVEFTAVAYEEFSKGMGLLYEYKWR